MTFSMSVLRTKKLGYKCNDLANSGEKLRRFDGLLNPLMRYLIFGDIGRCTKPLDEPMRRGPCP